jgi:RNA polymerase sigma-70 factor (ECF subfamily)
MDEVAERDGGCHDAATIMGGPASFEMFFHDERDRLFRVMCVITGSRQEAEDLTQEAFARVWERWGQVGAMDNPTGYLHRTAMNLFRSRFRRAKLAAQRILPPAPDRDEMQVVDDRQVALHALAMLPPRQRAAIVLTEVLRYTAEETGRMLGVRASTVRALHFQARSSLKQLREVRDE